MYLLGFDIGSSSVKVNLIEAETGKSVATDFQPKQEMKMTARQAGWAEQEPDAWWQHMKVALQNVLKSAGVPPANIKAIGISYQMHGLVAVDKNMQVVRPSIIWCDSRAVEIGNQAFEEIGGKECLSCLLNAPGNFTASKLKWVKENEPEKYDQIDKIMLPGDYIAARLTGEINTTVSGLSEGIFWDFKKNKLAGFLLKHYGFDNSLIPEIVPSFSEQGTLSREASEELGLEMGTPVAYRAGDQPNNAFSLNVLNPGEIAATAGTSGVVYGVSDEVKYDPESRVNTFAHVNHGQEGTRLGVLLCVNGTGILNAWAKKNIAPGLDYPGMNELAAKSPIGSRELAVMPFGNGAERVLKNQNIGASFHNLNFNIHSREDMLRAAQEGIVFSFKYGMDIMETTGIKTHVIRAGKANMFLSPIFRDTLAGITGATIELYDTDGSKGAALGAGVGAGVYKNFKEAFVNLEKIDTVEPNTKNISEYHTAYQHWKKILDHYIH
jgi:xylulokinase